MSREKHEICDILIVNSPLTTNQFFTSKYLLENRQF